MCENQPKTFLSLIGFKDEMFCYACGQDEPNVKRIFSEVWFHLSLPLPQKNVALKERLHRKTNRKKRICVKQSPMKGQTSFCRPLYMEQVVVATLEMAHAIIV